jgi:hypothetical protein
VRVEKNRWQIGNGSTIKKYGEPECHRHEQKVADRAAHDCRLDGGLQSLRPGADWDGPGSHARRGRMSDAHVAREGEASDRSPVLQGIAGHNASSGKDPSGCRSEIDHAPGSCRRGFADVAAIIVSFDLFGHRAARFDQFR